MQSSWKMVRFLAVGTLAAAAIGGLAGCPPGGQGSSGGAPDASSSAKGPEEAPQLKEARAMLDAEIKGRAKILQNNLAISGRIKASFGFADSSLCVTPPPVTEADIDVDRSLFVHDRETLDAADFSLRHTLSQLAGQAVAAGATSATAESLFVELWDTQNPSSSTAGSGAHCDDDGSTVNGYPNACRPADGAQANDPATEIDGYWPIGIVNRMDLAHEGFRNCGEHRIVYGRRSPTAGREFIIFEAVLPNPKPGCRSACVPVAQMWQSLSSEPVAVSRAKMLAKFYYAGLPGFRPVVHIDHYTAKGATSAYGSSGSGQIRTNQFGQGPWLLNEFRLALDCTSAPCNLRVVPTMLKVNPFGTLWSQEIATTLPPDPFQTRAMAFQASMITPNGAGATQIGNLAGKDGGCPATPDVNGFSYAVDLAFDAADSAATGSPPDNYTSVYNPSGAVVPGLFRDKVKTSPDLCGLSDQQIVQRATAMSCAGCHEPPSFGLTAPNSMAPGLSWPASLGFVHTSETPAGGIHVLSPALVNEFLPARRRFLVSLLNQPVCSCTGRFPFLAEPVRIKAQAIERIVLDEAQRKIATESDRVKSVVDKAREAGKPSPVAEIRKAQDAITRLRSAADDKLFAELKKQGIEVASLKPDLTPDVVKLDKVPRDPKAARAALQKLVIDQILAEPARKTVTGTFRVH